MGQVSWDDEKVGNRIEQLKFKAKTWTRFCILDQNAELEKMHFSPFFNCCTKHGFRKEVFCIKCANKLTEQQTGDGSKHYFCANCNILDPQSVARCWWCDNLKKEPEDRFAANVVVYLTDPQGQPLGPMGERSFYITFWVFGPDKFKLIRQNKKEFGDLRNRDFMFYCTEDKYQNGQLQIQANAWWKMDPAFQAMVVKAYKENKIRNLSDKIARFVPYEEQAYYIANDGKRPRQQRGGQQGQQNGVGGQGGGQQGGFDPAAVARQVGNVAPMFSTSAAMTARSAPPEVDPATEALLDDAPAARAPVATQPITAAIPQQMVTTPNERDSGKTVDGGGQPGHFPPPPVTQTTISQGGAGQGATTQPVQTFDDLDKMLEDL